jgi:hypothetical protein
VHGDTYLAQKEADAASAAGAPGDSMHYGVQIGEVSKRPNWFVRSFGGDSFHGGNQSHMMHSNMEAVAATTVFEEEEQKKVGSNGEGL